MSEKELWNIIEKSKWSSDHDYNRISYEWKLILNKHEFEELSMFIDSKHADLYSRFSEDWLGEDGNGGFDCGDDGYMDLIAEVVGRGKDFYENITADKLRTMAKEDDYHECFLYCIQD
jgi:hypothetical protein